MAADNQSEALSNLATDLKIGHLWIVTPKADTTRRFAGFSEDDGRIQSGWLRYP